MGGSRAEVLLLLLTGIVLLLMVAIIGLFLRMNQLQREVLAALEPLRPAQPPAGLSPGTQAPAFTLPDLSGRSVSLEALAGRRVLLAFASPHCPACREMYPHLRAFAEAHPDVAVVMVSLGTPEREPGGGGGVRAGFFGLRMRLWDLWP
jgi:Peroxiredoxin